MVHFDNLEYILQNGMCNRSHLLADPNYINIGDGELIKQREDYPVQIAPGGSLGDYVPFYFGGHSIMLLNIKTGYRGITQRKQADIAFIVCSIGRIVKYCPDWCFTNGHAKNSITKFYNKLTDLNNVDWDVVYRQYWHNTDDDWDITRRKQAEFLVKDHVPIECITTIAVYNEQRKEQLEAIIARLGLQIPVRVDTKRSLYYP